MGVVAEGQRGLKQTAETSSLGTTQGNAEMGLFPVSGVDIFLKVRWKEAGNELVLLP